MRFAVSCIRVTTNQAVGTPIDSITPADAGQARTLMPPNAAGMHAHNVPYVPIPYATAAVGCTVIAGRAT